MSDLLIKGMDLPKKGRVSLIAVFSDGDVKYIDRETFFSFRLPQKAIELPPHGRLIDATELEASDAIIVGEDAWNMVHNAPTIIEASKETD